MREHKHYGNFITGHLAMTARVNDLCENNLEFAEFVNNCLRRHMKGDWGNVNAFNQQSNDMAMKSGSRLVSHYDDPRFPQHGVNTIWIITEADRSVTTVLFPDEYEL